MRNAKQTGKKHKVCPDCGRTYTAAPAISRKDIFKMICPSCGQKEALEAWEAAQKQPTR